MSQHRNRPFAAVFWILGAGLLGVGLFMISRYWLGEQFERGYGYVLSHGVMMLLLGTYTTVRGFTLWFD